MSTVSGHFKKGLLSGILVVLPLFITAVVLRFLLGKITGLLSPLLLRLFPTIQNSELVKNWVLPVVSVVILLAILYLLGLTTRFFMGRWMINRVEQLLLRIPLLSSLYGSSREIVQIFLNPDRASSFKEVVLVEFPGPGLRTLGFVTGATIDPLGRSCYKVFIPTTPNPTSGFLMIVEKSQVIHCGISVEDGVKMIMSGGLLGPERLTQIPAGEKLEK